MRIKNYIIAGFTASLTALLFVITGCGETQQAEDIPQDEKIVTEKTTILNIGNKLFYIPNPIQSALLMKKIAVPYNKEMLNKANNVENYSITFKQAVNIGVYGADIGYITANDQNQEAITHLGAIKKLSDALGISSAFDFSAMEEFSNNVGNQQQMLALLTSAYKSCEDFLKKNERGDVAGLIMAGALIEGLYFASNIAKDNPDQEVINRIGEQKQSLDNVITILNPHYSVTNAPELSEFIDQLVELQGYFNGVHSKYSFAETTCDNANKTCTINGKSEIEMSGRLLESITLKIQKIREFITS